MLKPEDFYGANFAGDGVEACSCLTAAPRFTYEKGAETILDLICDGRGGGGYGLRP